MIKRFLSLVLSLVMVLSMLPAAVVVMAEGAHIHCMCGETVAKDALCASCGTKAVEWTATSTLGASTAPGNYYFTKNIAVDPWFITSGEYAFCLCGHDLTAGSAGKRIIDAAGEGVKVTFTDCAAEAGSITGATGASATGSTLCVNTQAQMNLYNINITGNKAATNGVILVARGGILNMYSGSISGNESGRGAIYVQDDDCVANLLGGIITGNHAKNTGNTGGGGGVYGMKGVINLGGAIRIVGNTAAAREPDLYIRNDQGAKLQLSADKPMENGAKVRYNVWTAETSTTDLKTITGAPAAWSSTWLRLNGTKVGYADGKFFLDTAADHVHCMCGAETADGKTCASCGTQAVEWSATGTAPTTDGYYYLTQTVKTEKVDLKANVSICLNEKNLESASGATVVKVFPGYSLQLTDCGEAMGSVTGVTATTAFDVQTNASFTLWNGKITGNTGTGNGTVWVAQGTATLPGATFTMYGGEISGNKTGRGAVFTAVPSAGIKLATVRLLGGKITGNTGSNTSASTGSGAGLYALSPVEIGGALQIYGNDAATGPDDVFLRNDSTFTGSLVVSSEKPLTAGANICYDLKVAETDAADLKTITGSPATWDETWITYAGQAVYYAEGKFTTQAPSVPEPPAAHVHCLCGEETTLDKTCAACGSKAVTWTGIDAVPSDKESGYYYLTDDITFAPFFVNSQAQIAFCLCGHDIISAEGKRIMDLQQGAVVSITDCAEEVGSITGTTGATNYGSALRANDTTTLNIYNGRIENNVGGDGLIYVDVGGTLNIYGGEFINNTVKRGVIYAPISSNDKVSTIRILGGTITGNTGTATAGMSGGAGVYSFFSVEVGGDAKIYGNTATNEKADMLLRNDGDYAAELIISETVPLTSGANICYDLFTDEADATNLQFITGAPATWDKTWVKYAGDAVSYADGKFFTKEAPQHVHCMCGAEVTLDATCAKCGTKAVAWTGVTELPTDAGGNYFLAADIATTSLTYSGSLEANICLNGKTLSSKNGYKIINVENGAAVSITDCAGTGKVTGTSKDTYGLTIRVNAASTFTLWNGKITGNAGSTTGDGVIYVDKGTADTLGGTFVMYGGEIFGNTARRGIIYGALPQNVKEPVIRILGGTITGNSTFGTGSTGGGAVMAFSPVEVGGKAVICDNTSALAGTADLYLRNDYNGKLVVSTEKPLESGAKICYALSVADADPMQLQYITGTPASWDNSWVKYDGKEVGYENGRFYTKKSLDMANHAHGGQNWVSVTQDNGQRPGADGYYVLESNVTLSQLITVAQDSHVHLCLNGYTLTAAPGNAHFEVLGKLTICDCTAKTENGVYIAGKIAGGNGKTGGSARVRQGGEMYLEAGIFTNNHCAEGGNGGVVYLDGATTDKAAAVFKMTGGQLCGNSGAYGGAIRLGAATYGLAGPTFILEDGTICHNESSNYGGAIHGAGGADIRLIGGVIEANKAANGGGAISVNSQSIQDNVAVNTSAKITLTGTVIRDNQAETWGGNIYIKSGTVMDMQGGVITGGSSKVGAGILLESEGTTLNLSGGQINGNKAGSAGAGGVYASNNTIVNMTGGQINDNTAEGSGGGLVLYAAKGQLTGGTISGNTASGAGGLSIQGAEAYLGKITISNNTTTGSSGGVYVSRAGSINSEVIIDGAQIINNTCKTSGGGIFLYMNGNKITMEDGLISGNQGGDGGGVVAQREVTFTMNGGTISNNKATSNGGGYYASIDSTFIMNGGKISGNYTAKNGGGLYGLRANVQLNGGTISGNTAKNSSGGAHCTGATVKLAGTAITGNKTESGSCGGVFIGQTSGMVDGVKKTFNGSLVMTGGEISYNTTPKAGGGLLIQSQGTVVDMYGGSINNNTSTKFAGGIYVGKGAAFNMHGGKVCYNKTESDVGAGIHHDGGSGNYTGGEIFGNVTTRSGGGILVGGTGNVVTLKNVKIYDNSAKVAAGVILQGRATLNMENCEIYGNKTTQNGAGIYAYTYVTLNLKDCYIHDNVAGEDGGGVWSWATSYVNMDGCLVENNQATKGQGGGIWTRGDGFTMENCTIRGNTSAKQGGGVYAGMMGSATPRKTPGLFLINSLVESNEAQTQGGGMYVSGGAELHLTQSTFTGNKAGAEAGALWVKDEFTLDGMTATGNISGGEGFAVWLDDSDFDGQSYLSGLMRFTGDIQVMDNQGGNMYLGEKTAIVIGEAGLGQNTNIQLTMHSGLLTDWVWGAYNYEGGEQVYTITYGDRSVTDPEVDASLLNAQKDAAKVALGDIALYAGIGVFALAVIAVVAILLLKKKKSPAGETK